MELLLNRGAAIDSPKENGATPLWFACKYGFTAVVELLLERGSTANDQPDNEGCTPLWIASQNGHPAVIELLLEREPEAGAEK